MMTVKEHTRVSRVREEWIVSGRGLNSERQSSHLNSETAPQLRVEVDVNRSIGVILLVSRPES